MNERAGVYLWLRRSFNAITRSFASTHFARILRGLFPLGIMLPALLGFVSVTFYSCGQFAVKITCAA